MSDTPGNSPDTASSAPGTRVRQTRKSIATHRRIIEAAIQCFLEIGYHRTTTSEIAKRAKVTRGAVQYYFPTTAEVLRATVDYIQDASLREFDYTMHSLPAGSDTLDASIDSAWQRATGPLWTVWMELLAAARTDGELRGVMEAAVRAYDEQSMKLVVAAFPDLHARDPERLALGRQITWQLVQGLARLPIDPAEKQRMLTRFKGVMHELWGLGAAR